MALYEYKSTQRNTRVQNVEERFNKGMQFTNTPLDEGWSKFLVNFDMIDSGVAMTPRPGLQATHMFMPETGNGAETVVAAHEQYISASETRMQLLTIAKNANDKYDLRVVTGSPAEVAHDKIEHPLYDQVQWHNYKVSDPIEVSCIVPSKAEIHGLEIDNTNLVKHPGVYAWNENYYFFDAQNNKVVHTEWDETTEKYIFKSDPPKEINSKEAVTYGYNMLQAQPYHFVNTEIASGGVIQFTGMMPYDSAGNLCLTPVKNQTLSFEIFYAVPLNAKYKIIVEWKTAVGDVWEKIKEFDHTFADLSSLKIPFSPPDPNIIIRVSAFSYGTDNTVKDYSDATLAVGFSFNKDEYGSTANIEPKNYSISKATGVTYWKNRMVAWGIPEDQNLLFMSDINDPTYFPYPDGCDTFEEPVKYAVPFLDNLLVFTSSKLYILSLSADGLSWTKKCIQNNLTIADWDIHLIQVVKNMVFFRSGNYFYMIVPKVGSASGELSLAAISKPLYYYFDKFADYTKAILEQVYGKAVELTLKHYYNYLDFEDVHNVYVFDTGDGELLNFSLLYSTVDRHWRVYITGSPGIMLPYKQNMTRKGQLCLASVQNTDKIVYQVIEYNSHDAADFYNVDYNSQTPIELFNAKHIWRNWQGIDTGYREHNSNFKKRYRELQFVINNRSTKKLYFYTDFYLDGEQRKNKYKYKVVQNVDPASPDYGVITIERELTAPLIAPGGTVLGSSEQDTEAWELDVSRFPEVAFWKARFIVSGKGYVPRLVLVSRNEQPYELLNISWIYRAMYSR